MTRPNFDDVENGDETLTGLAQSLLDLSSQNEHLSIHRIRETLGERSFGPFLLVPAIIEISPIGGIPGIPTLIAIIISLFAAQVLLNRSHLWLPRAIEQRHIDGAKLANALRHLLRPLKYVDRVLKPRLDWTTKPPMLQLIAFCVIALVATVPALELIPFASTIPMISVALFGAALLCRDGLVALLALSSTFATVALIVWSLL